MTRRLLVEVTGQAWDVYRRDENQLPGDTVATIRTEGRSQIVEVSHDNELPRVISCGTDGCRAHPLDTG